MEYSEIVLIALVLLIVFCGMQIPKLLDLLSPKRPSLASVKTVIKAEPIVQTPHKVGASKVKAVPAEKKSVSVKKSAPAKKTAAKKTAKKAVTKKKVAKK